MFTMIKLTFFLVLIIVSFSFASLSFYLWILLLMPYNIMAIHISMPSNLSVQKVTIFSFLTSSLLPSIFKDQLFSWTSDSCLLKIIFTMNLLFLSYVTAPVSKILLLSWSTVVWPMYYDRLAMNRSIVLLFF